MLSLNEFNNIPDPNKAVILTASQFLGVKEIYGAESNPTILKFWELLNITWAKDDNVAWCAAAHNAILKLAGCNYYESGLARKTLDLKDTGITIESAILGDSVVFSRGSNPTHGHVGIFIRAEGTESNRYIVCLGGNQSDEFRASRYPASRLLGFRRPTFI